jgi:hypothetical protein
VPGGGGCDLDHGLFHVARKMGVDVAHVEAGIRSGDWTMPDEINRIVTDSLTNLFFTTSVTAHENLRKCGVDEACIFFVGNYIVLSLHRPANVDEEGKLKAWKLSSVIQGACRWYFPFIREQPWCWRNWDRRRDSTDNRTAGVPGIQLSGQTRQSGADGFWRHYGRDDSYGHTLHDAAGQYREAGDGYGGNKS